MSESNVYPTATAVCPGCKRNVAFMITQDNPLCPTCDTPLLPTRKPLIPAPDPANNARRCGACAIEFSGNLCPKCDQPGDPIPVKRGLSTVEKVGLLIVAGLIGFFASPGTPSSSSRPTPAPAAKGTDAFLPAAGNITPGVQFYIKDTLQPVAICKRVESGHRFPDGTTRDGVLLYFPDGVEQWIPRDAVKLLYVVRADDPKR